MGFCKDCRHWHRNAHPPAYQISPGGWSTCVRGEGSGGEADDRGSLMYATDSSKWAAHVMVHADFGCNQHAPKP